MWPWLTMTTGKGPSPFGIEIVPVIGWPPLVQRTWYLTKPSPAHIRSRTSIVPACEWEARTRRASIEYGGGGVGTGVAAGAGAGVEDATERDGDDGSAQAAGTSRATRK